MIPPAVSPGSFVAPVERTVYFLETFTAFLRHDTLPTLLRDINLLMGVADHSEIRCISTASEGAIWHSHLHCRPCREEERRNRCSVSCARLIESSPECVPDMWSSSVLDKEVSKVVLPQFQEVCQGLVRWRHDMRAGPGEVPGSRVHSQGGHGQASAQDDDDEEEMGGKHSFDDRATCKLHRVC